MVVDLCEASGQCFCVSVVDFCETSGQCFW